MQDPQQTNIESVIHNDELNTVPNGAISDPMTGGNGANGTATNGNKAVVSANGKTNGRVKVPAANGSDNSATPGTRGMNAPGLTMERRFTKPGENVYETVEWEMRDAVISNERGEKVFEQTNVEIPKTWTQLATNVVVSKYFRGHIGTPERETSVRQLISRVADTMANWGRKDGYFATEADAQTFQDELTHILLHQKAAFNSPVWFNVGLADQPSPQVSACFINSVDDTMQSILTLAKTEGMLFKYGSGTGTNFSTIRGSSEPLNGGGTASGPVSFMRGLDQFAGAIKSGGKTRRAAKMNLLDVNHPDIVEFINCKAKEEKKAHTLIDAGYSGMFNVPGGAYDSVLFQNANNSVRVTDEFMQTWERDGEWETKYVLAKEPARKYQARDLMRQIGESAWICGDPGMQYDTTINKWHTCKNTDRIYASNPCCFVGETLVDTSQGRLRFDEVERLSNEGEELPCALAFDLKTGSPVLRPIVKAWVAGETRNLVDVITEAGVKLRCTPEHRFLTFAGEYMPAEELRPGTLLRTTDRAVFGAAAAQQETAGDAVRSVTPVTLTTPVKVYDLEVADVHNLSVITPGATSGHSIVVSNSEFVFLNDTACNLASINLMKFRHKDKSFDIEAFKHACRVLITAQEIIVDNASYPTPRVAENSHDYRPLGLGYANLGALLMANGLAYDSDEGRALAGAITSVMTGEGYHQSCIIARDHGWPFPGYQKNREPFIEVMKMHRAAVEDIDSKFVPDDLLQAARKSWDDTVEKCTSHGCRNAQATVLAPTGCLVAGSMVVTDRGMMRLNRLGDVNGDQWQDVAFRVLTDEGERQATKFYVNGIELTRRIETASGYAIQGTLKHRIKVVDAQSGQWEWKRFSDIQPGDVVPLSMGKLSGEPRIVHLPPLGEEYWTGDYNTTVPRTLTPELAELVGYFMGDGSLHAKGPRFCVANADQDVAERVRTLVKSLFNLEARITQQEGYCEVGVHSVPLALWWEACGFAKFAPHAGHKGKGYRPHVPDALLATNDPQTYGAFLRGLYEADGTVTGGVPCWTTAHREFAEEVKTVLLALGLPTTTKLDTSGWGQSRLYCVRLCNTAYNVPFLNTVGFMGQRKTDRISRNQSEQTARHDYIYLNADIISALAVEVPELQNAIALSIKRHGGAITRRAAQTLYEKTGNPRLAHALGFFYDKVATNEDGGEQLTYDLSVPDNVTYIANGFVSHNTIGFLMDCDTTGIEPDIAIVKYKNLVGGGMMKIVNNTVPEALERLGYGKTEADAIIAYIDANDTIEGAPGLKPEHLPVFDCAFKPGNGERSIHYMGHVKMMAAAQPFLSGAISKTVNMPHEATPDEIASVYVEGWKLGLKAIAIYRDGSKRTQPLMTKKADDPKVEEKAEVVETPEAKAEKVEVIAAPVPAPTTVARPFRRKLPDERLSITHKFSVAGHEGYITVGMYEDGTPGEIFLTMSKEGSTISGLMDAFATAISLALQYGVPLQTLVDKFAHSRFEPSGYTNNPNIRFAKSIMDYIFRYLATKFQARQPGAEEQPTLTSGIGADDGNGGGNGNGNASGGTVNGVNLSQAARLFANPAAVSTTSDVVQFSAAPITLTASPKPGKTLAEQEHETFQNQADAPICTECGSLMVRNGACYKCLNCGSVFGCS